MGRTAGALVVAALVAGCQLHSANNESGGAINLAVHGDFVVVARGTAGLDVVRAGTGELTFHVAPSGCSDSYDDVSASDGVVLAHDADDEYLTSFLLSATGTLELAQSDVEVPAGPYSGVGSGGGVAIVSGGICGISLLSVDGAGALAPLRTLELSRGQPDVAMLPLGRGALLSTHFSGDSDEFVDGAEFGVTSIALPDLSVRHRAGLSGAGFTDGGGRPASFPLRAAVAGELAYVAHGGGLDLFRVGTDLRMERVAHLDLPIAAVDVAVDGARAYVAGVPSSVVVVDVSDPTVPQVERVLEVPGDRATPTAVLVTAGRVFVAANAAGLVTLTP